MRWLIFVPLVLVSLPARSAEWPSSKRMTAQRPRCWTVFCLHDVERRVGEEPLPCAATKRSTMVTCGGMSCVRREASASTAAPPLSTLRLNILGMIVLPHQAGKLLAGTSPHR
jgi:hypothetical protein